MDEELDQPASDARDVEAARGGDAEAFGRLVERYANALAALAYDRLGSVADAQDMTQETFVQAWARLALLREPGKFAPWVHEILKAQCAMRLRRRGVERRHLERAVRESAARREGGQSATLDRMVTRERDAALRAAVESLSPPLRAAVALRYFSDCGRTQAAGLLGLGLDAFDKRIERALRELRGKMSE